MTISRQAACVVCLALWVGTLVTSCGSGSHVIVPEKGYQWPPTERAYWPTEGFRTASPEAHGIDPERLELADRFAREDALARALLVVKDGYLVYESYYGDGGVDKSTNLWSVTKSFASAIVGMVKDRGLLRSTDQRMADLLPGYPKFDSITLHQVLTHTTGLDWLEKGLPWVQWAMSPDWVASALNRGPVAEPGERFCYSSANSQFLTAMTRHLTGQRQGAFARVHLFEPLGIRFEPVTEAITYDRWDDYIPPLPQSWRQDPMGTETGGFGLYLTARDMAKFGFLFLNRGVWDGRQIVSEDWVIQSTRDQITDVYGRYSYGYHWWITSVAGHPTFLASGFGGQIIGVVPSLDLVVVIKYEAETPEHPKPGTAHDDMRLFELVVESVQ